MVTADSLFAVNAAELAHISAILIGAIAGVRAHAKQFGIDTEFREILHHAGDMHDLLIENHDLATGNMRAVARNANRKIEQLAALAEMPGAKMQ